MARDAQMIRVTFADGSSKLCKPYTMVSSLIGSGALVSTGLPVLAALVNNEVSSLSYPLTADSSIEFLTIADSDGWRIYRNSLSFILAKAVNALFPKARLGVHHSSGSGLYWTLELDPDHPDQAITRAQAGQIENCMRNIIERDITIERRKLSFAQAVEHFTNAGQLDKLNLLQFRNPPRIVIHCCDGFSDLAHSPLASSTGCLGVFKLIHRAPGFVLQFPSRKQPAKVQPFKDQPMLFQIFSEHK